MNKLSSENLGTVRTAVNAAVITGVVWVGQRVTGVEVDPSDPLVIAGAAAVVGVGYRASRFLTDRFPSLGWVLFGIPAAPSYSELPPPTTPNHPTPNKEN